MPQFNIDFKFKSADEERKYLRALDAYQRQAIDGYLEGRLVCQLGTHKGEYATWLLKVIGDFLGILNRGITAEETEVSLLESPIEITFAKRNQQIKVGIKLMSHKEVISSVMVDEKELAQICINTANRLLEFVIESDQTLAEEEPVRRFVEKNRLSQEKYGLYRTQND